MDISSLCGKVKSKSSSGGLVNRLDSNCGELLDIKDLHEQNISDKDVVSCVEEGFEHLKLDDTKPGQKSLCKYATFPTDAKVLPSGTYSNEQDEDEELEIALRQMFSDESVISACTRSISLPTPLKLVSAMKGSRERLGAAPRKLTVKWAPDVYDPPPTIVSHTVNRGKRQKLKEERNNKQKKGKKGRKGNSSHGGSKDKKQFRKISGINDKCYKLMNARNGVVELPDGINDFEVAGPESYCGSSFLKESLTKVHYSVAEAL